MTQELKFAPKEVVVDERPDGTLILRSPLQFIKPDWTILDFLPKWAETHPDHVFLAQRGKEGSWDKISYAEMWSKVRATGQALLAMGAKPKSTVAILSGNSIEHAIMTLAAMSVGLVVAPISPNYTLMPGGLVRLQEIVGLLKPSFVFAQNSVAYAAARTLSELMNAVWITVDEGAETTPIDSLFQHKPGPEFDEAFKAIDPSDTAKILFTSGSTGMPKGVINTHVMMACALQMGSQLVVPELHPVQVEWLPWHHTMGSNVIFNGILKNGGTLYIDDGRPVPQLFHKTIENLREISPTAMFNVPAGYALLCDALEADEALRNRFFEKINRMSYGGSAISEVVLTKLYALSARTAGRRVPVMSGYGATEAAPIITTTHWATEEPGELGLPPPGLQLKLVPVGDTYEARVRGPNVTPGYLNRPDLTEAAFDEEGFYRIGDTVSFLDRHEHRQGLQFTGRISENFKLSNGTWVVVGNVRAQVIQATDGLLLEAVIVGENRAACAMLAWLSPAAAKLGEHSVLQDLRKYLRDYNDRVGSSERISRVILLKDPPSMAAGEITDKAYINQRAVQANRSIEVEMLYADKPPAGVLVI